MFLRFDFDVDAGWQSQRFQCIDRFAGRIEDIDQAFMGANLKLLARFAVDVR